MGYAFSWEQDDDIRIHFYACACPKRMWESNDMTIRIIRFLVDFGSILSWSPKNITCSCYNNDFTIHYSVVWKHCGSLDWFRSVLVVVLDDLKMWWAIELLLMCGWYPIIPLKLTGCGHAEKAIDNGYGVDMSMFLSDEMMPPCQPSPTKCLLPLDALWNSYRRLCTWEFTNIYLWRIDWIVVLPMLLVMSCWWSYGHLPTDKRRIKHSEQ